MKETTVRTTVQIGDLVAAAFDEAAEYSADPAEISRLAAAAVNNLLERFRRVRTVERQPTLQKAAS